MITNGIHLLFIIQGKWFSKKYTYPILICLVNKLFFVYLGVSGIPGQMGPQGIPGIPGLDGCNGTDVCIMNSSYFENI